MLLTQGCCDCGYYTLLDQINYVSHTIVHPTHTRVTSRQRFTMYLAFSYHMALFSFITKSQSHKLLSFHLGRTYYVIFIRIPLQCHDQI